MRYLPPRRKGVLPILKIVLSLILTVAVSFSVIKLYGNDIAMSAYNYISAPVFNAEPVNQKDTANFENDFLTFLDYKEKEEATEPVTLNTVTNDTAIAVNLSALSGKYKTYNGTSVINNTDYDVSELLYADYKKPVIDKSKPAVLIYHTHTSEGYYGGGTVVDVGNAMVEEFEKLGYKTVHITESYDKGQFSGAYSRSIKGVQKALEENPDIKLVFDVHRDAITASNGDTYQPLTEIEGKKCAQVMFVCGTDAKGLSHPSWRENFKFALDVSRTMGISYGALSRPVNLRGDRFNTHTTPHSFLMEIGSNANTLDEAKLAAVYTVRAVVDTIN